MISFGPPETDWLNPIINLSAVLLGAVLTWITAYTFEIKKENQRDLAIAYSLLFKVQHFTNELVQLEREVYLGIQRAEADGADGPLWTKLVDLIGFRNEPVTISAEELALVARTRDVALVMKIRELESGHLIIMSVWSKISLFRRQLAETDLAESVKGRVVTFAASPEQQAKIAPLMINLNDLSEGLKRDLPRIASEARSLAGKLGAEIKRHYKFKHFVTLHIPDPTEIQKGRPI